MALHLGTALLSPYLDAEIQNLALESDPVLREEGILSLAGREEQKGEYGIALELYSSVTETSLQERAHRRIEALSGRGPIEDRAEILVRHLTQEAANPASLLAMGVASSVFRVTRLAVLANLSSRPSGNLLGTLGTRFLANCAGLALEAPAFTLASRALRSDGPSENSQASFGTELASSYLFLAALKMGGSLGSGITRRYGANQAFASSLARQGSLLAGIALGRRLETMAGLRPSQDGASLLVDSLSSLLTFHVSGRLARHAFGENFAAWEQGLESRSEQLINRLPPGGGMGSLGFPALEWNLAGRGEALPQRPALTTMMSSNGKGPNSEEVPTVRLAPISPAPDGIRVSDLYMILVNLPRAVQMTAPRITYDGDAWSEARDAATIAGRLRSRIALPRGSSLELNLIRQKQRLCFFWEGDLVTYQVSSEGGTAVSRNAPGPAKLADTLPAMQAVTSPRPGTANGTYSLRFGKEHPPEHVSPNGTTFAAPQTLFGDWKSYEADLDHRIEVMYRQRFAKISSDGLREESSALRGRRLARIVNSAFKAESDQDTLPSSHPIETAVHVQAILEHAYGHFDFDTIRAFRERLSVLGGESFDNAISLRNFAMAKKGRPLYLQTAELALDLPGNYLIPREAGWRDGFLSEWVQGKTYETLARQVPELLKSPELLARLSAPLMQNRLSGFQRSAQALQDRYYGEPLADLLNPDRKYTSDADVERRAQALSFLGTLPEFSRLLVSGQGKFHQQFIRQLFFTGSVPLAEPYRNFLQLMQQLPDQRLALQNNRLFLPGLPQLRDFARSSARPNSR